MPPTSRSPPHRSGGHHHNGVPNQNKGTTVKMGRMGGGGAGDGGGIFSLTTAPMNTTMVAQTSSGTAAAASPSSSSPQQPPPPPPLYKSTAASLGLVAQQATSFYALQMRNTLPEVYQSSAVASGSPSRAEVALANKKSNGMSPNGGNSHSTRNKGDQQRLQVSLQQQQYASSPAGRGRSLLLAPIATPTRGGGLLTVQSGGAGMVDTVATTTTAYLTTRQQHRHAALIEDEVRMLDQRVAASMSKLTALLSPANEDDAGRDDDALLSKTYSTPMRLNQPHQSSSPFAQKKNSLSPSSVGGRSVSLPPITTMSSPAANNMTKKRNAQLGMGLNPVFSSPNFKPLSPAVKGPPPPHPSMPMPANSLTLNVDEDVIQRQRYLKELERVAAKAAQYSAVIERNKRLQAEAEEEAAHGGRKTSPASRRRQQRQQKDSSPSAKSPEGEDKEGDSDDKAKKAGVKRTIQSVIAEWQQVVNAEEAARRQTFDDPSPSVATTSGAGGWGGGMEIEEIHANNAYEALELRRINRARERMGLAPLGGGGGRGQRSPKDDTADMSAAATAHRKLVRRRLRLNTVGDHDEEDKHIFLTGTDAEKQNRLKEIEKRVASQVLKEHLGGDGGSGPFDDDGPLSSLTSPRTGGITSPVSAGTSPKQSPRRGVTPNSKANNNNKSYNATFMDFMRRHDEKDANKRPNPQKEQQRGEEDERRSPSNSPRGGAGAAGGASSSGLLLSPRGGGGVTSPTSTSNSGSTTARGGGTTGRRNNKNSSPLNSGPTFEELMAEKELQKQKALETVHLLTHRHWKLAKGSSVDVLPEPRLTAAVVTTLHGEMVLMELEVRRGNETIGGGGLMGSAHANMLNGGGGVGGVPNASIAAASPPSSSPSLTAPSTATNVQTLWVRIEQGWVAAELAVPSVRSETVMRLVKEAGQWAGSAMVPPDSAAKDGLLDAYLRGSGGNGNKKGSDGANNNNTTTNSAVGSSAPPPATEAAALALLKARPVEYELIRQLTPLAVQPLADVSVAALLQEVVDARGDQIQRALAHCPPESLTRHEYFGLHNRPAALQAKAMGANTAATTSNSNGGHTANSEEEQRFKLREDELFRRQQMREQSFGHAAIIRQTWEAMGGYNAGEDDDLMDDLQPPDLLPDAIGGGRGGANGQGGDEDFFGGGGGEIGNMLGGRRV